MFKKASKPKLSIVVIFFNMRREAIRTLFTLSGQYQRQVDIGDYQVIVIDNGSTEPLDTEFVSSFGNNFEYHYYPTDSPSPAAAINFGVSQAKGELVGCIVDGARMQSPRVVYYTLRASSAFDHPFVCSLAWHLGPKEQNQSMLEGYNQDEEDNLLKNIDWREDGYQLFDVSTQASSSRIGFSGGLPAECSYFAMNKKALLDLGGFDERFQSGGGGLMNHDLLQRVVERATFDFIVLFGEGSFHQFHGGIATNTVSEKHPMKLFLAEYESIYGRHFTELTQPRINKVHYLGSMHSSIKNLVKID